MVKPSESPYGTVPSGQTSYGTVPRGHQSPLRSTASDTSVVSKRSHATIRHPRSRSVSNPPFQISLNLVMKVQPLDNDEYCLEPIELCLNDVNMSKNGQQQHQLSHRQHRGPAEKKNNQTPVNRYKNKRSLLAFSSLQKQPRKKSSVRFDDDLPRRLSFDQSDDEDEVAGSRSPLTSTPKDSQADKKKSQTTGNRYKNKQSLLKFPSIEKARSKSEGHALPGFEPYSPPRPLNFSDTARLTEGDETALMKSGAADKTFPLDKTFQNSLGLGVSNLDDSVFTNGKDDGKKNSSISSTASTSFTDVSPKDVACDLDVGQASKIYDHQKQMRIGFLANGIPMAVNLVLNLRSDEEVLYLEPVELIYEREKMWRRPIRQVAKEIEEKRLADKMKKETLNASKATSGSYKSAPTSPNVSK